MQMMMIPRNSIFKNLPDSPFKETTKFFPYKTQRLRVADYSKSRVTPSRRLEGQKINSTYSQQAHQVTLLIKQEQQKMKKQNKEFLSQSKVKSPSMFRKNTNNYQNLLASGLVNLSPNFTENIDLFKKTETRSPDFKRNPIESERQVPSKQKSSAFRKTFCLSLQKPFKNQSLQMRNLQKRPPTTQIQTYRPSTRIRKVSNIGEQANNNFLAKYEIIRELGKGTYGTVYLAKVIKDRNQKQISFNKICSNLSKMITNQSEVEVEVKNHNLSVQKVERFLQMTENISTFNDFEKARLQRLASKENSFLLNAINLGKPKEEQDLKLQADDKFINLNKNSEQSNLPTQEQNTSIIEKSPQIQKQHQKYTGQKSTLTGQEINKQQENSQNFQQDELVAIKVYQKFKMNKDPAKFKNIRKQITVMQNLAHSGVIKLYQSVESITKISLVVQFGGDLSLLDYLKKYFPLSKQKLKSFSQQLLDIIIYLHNKNIVHRDIKPQNILVKVDKLNPGQQQLKLIDYGFSTLSKFLFIAANKSRKLNAICGTPNFMAPELLSSKEYFGEKADVWSFGVVTFVMAEGRHPFKSSDYQQLSRIANKGKYVFKRKHQPLFEQFIGQVLKVNSQQRPTAQQISKFKWLQQQ